MQLGHVRIATVAFVLLVSGATAFWLLPPALVPRLDETVEGTVALIRSCGSSGVLGSIALMVVHSFVPFPAEIVACANGMIYGPLWGTVITWVGAMLGAAAAFGLARLLGWPFVRRILSAEHRERRCHLPPSAHGEGPGRRARLSESRIGSARTSSRAIVRPD